MFLTPTVSSLPPDKDWCCSTKPGIRAVEACLERLNWVTTLGVDHGPQQQIHLLTRGIMTAFVDESFFSASLDV